MKVALLEDDPTLAESLCGLLTQNGHHCHWSATGSEFMYQVTHESFDLLIMDWQLPDADGIELLKQLRSQMAWRVPVLFLTQRDTEVDIITALNAGADDYMVKPARPGELLARLQALVRRVRPDEQPGEEQHYGPFIINKKKHTITLHGEPLVLTDKDFDLTVFMFENLGRLLSRKLLLERIWGVSSEINTRTVDTHVSRLRRKLGIKPENGFRIKTIYQHGYRLEEVDPSNGAESE